MVNRINQTFARLKRNGRKALIGYITAGFPTKPSFQNLVPLLEKAGLDLLEVGIPFSDPIADGPMIQQSSQIALANGVTLNWVLTSIKKLRHQKVYLPIILMSYCNPIHAMGIDRFFHLAQAAGVDGLIIPDMIIEEADLYSRSAKKYGLDLIHLAAPTTPQARLLVIAHKTRGFLYVVSLTGVTGMRRALPAHLSDFLQSVKAVCRKPIAVGFGLSTPQQVHEIAQDADGVIVGSALIREIEKSKRSSFKGAGIFVESLAHALNRRKDATYAS